MTEKHITMKRTDMYGYLCCVLYKIQNYIL